MPPKTEGKVDTSYQSHLWRRTRAVERREIDYCGGMCQDGCVWRMGRKHVGQERSGTGFNRSLVSITCCTLHTLFSLVYKCR